MNSNSEPRWVPKQEKAPGVVDFRCLATGPKGYKESKRRREEEEEVLDNDDVGMMEEENTPMEEVQAAKRQKSDETNWRPVSGKVWKEARSKASLVMKPKLPTSWEQKMEEKAMKKMFVERKREAVAEIKAKRKAVAQQKRQALERKKINREKSAVVQTISKTSTIKKMMKDKKQRKLLKTA
uniref:Coiled-coil domain-containing protein 86 n=1 Tax=Polytomella parva TaxID=51329 RepID=A0A7S0US43_9CHLO|mmetsp:Transcript_19201/g.34745  ORF Transcript_19201/g.34745 Transcript_19201/m.34745 type:complete len:182 (+) Transcript_19201:1-546(+)|eukprot:CAMPEP_0175062700 /NCGR_PEP_ID=MMETSP0052_2-20121109/14319_1 /TAXON_ID=51329 ORGANISM="Polytomella parva, Strain SAG 63-3" /NCGR_SAMPLE_ID=MMETSP0052_2 /ASSEMBLY_ACC=CAM_ASM_000194 /LENGTH=181 /DNA_ID=CAMNT_0016328761 /DNA_START=3 /DNA_END=548 /DNA_ORIENTATION=+